FLHPCYPAARGRRSTAGPAHGRGHTGGAARLLGDPSARARARERGQAPRPIWSMIVARIRPSAPGGCLVRHHRLVHLLVVLAALLAAPAARAAQLGYSTYVGADDLDQSYAIALDGSNNAYVTGYTFSIGFPLKGALQSALA